MRHPYRNSPIILMTISSNFQNITFETKLKTRKQFCIKFPTNIFMKRKFIEKQKTINEPKTKKIRIS